jgi:uncharacterized damage-inducible protein DinB
MSEKSQLVLMAKYNQLMNQRIIDASSQLSEGELLEDKGAFFKSVLHTLNHIMIGDILWLKRFSAHPSKFISLNQLSVIAKPERLDELLFDNLPALQEQRSALDKIIINWCDELDEADLNSVLSYTNFKGEIHNKRLGDLILHLFLHQVHHRGQVTTLLSQQGIDFGETDLPEIVPEMQV